MLPFFNFTQPQIARALLMYRVRRLPQARLNARAHGYEGAMYPWESADTGEETTPQWTDPHPVTGQRYRVWTGDIEQHVSADVSYGIWQYYLATHDLAFIEQYGAEVIIETARFWLSRCVPNAENGRYDIPKVMGPDEYHEYYPGKSDEGGVDNNVYTNALARWNINKAVQIIGMFSKDKAEKLALKLGLTMDALQAWRQKAAKVAEKIYIPQDARTGVYEQHTGFFDLSPLDWKSPPYNGRPDMEVALRAESKDPADYQVLKQADVLMMLYLLPEMADRQVKTANYRYYEPRTSHGSSLSDAMHAIMAKETGRVEAAYEYFRKAAAIDLLDTKGNCANGIHAASLGGLWQATVCGFGGLALREDRLAINPRLPDQWARLYYRVLYRGSPVEVTIERSSLRVNVPTRDDGQEPIPMEIAGRNYTLHPGEERMAVI
jgi:kojibiose phosphorylase